jgi:hypothetical protein
MKLVLVCLCLVAFGTFSPGLFSQVPYGEPGAPAPPLPSGESGTPTQRQTSTGSGSSTNSGAACTSSTPFACARTDRAVVSTFGNYGANVDGWWADNGPPVNTPFTNQFGLQEVRVTDGNIPGGAFGGNGWSGPANWWTNYFSEPVTLDDPAYGSLTGYLLYVPLDNGGQNRLFIINQNTLQVSLYCPSSWSNCNMPYADEWSYATPGLMYFGSGSQVQSYNYVTQSGPNLVYDFASCLGSGVSVGDVQVSHDDSVVGVSAWTSTTTFLAIYNQNTHACHWIDTSTGQTDMGAASLSPWPGGAVHNIWMNMSGDWGIITGLAGSNIFWQIGTANTTVCTIFDDCEGHIALGVNDAFYVISAPATSGVSVPPHYDFGLFPMSDPTGGSYTSGPYVRLHPTGPPYFNADAPDTECNVDDTHPNWNTGNDSMPIVESSFVDTDLVADFSLMQINCAWDHEIDAVAADGSGTTYRLAHNRASGLDNVLAPFQSSYNALSMPVCSSDEVLCEWATDWANGNAQGQLGTQTEEIPGGIGCSGQYGCAWQPSTGYSHYQEIIDSNGNEEMVTTAGTSSANPPAWPTVIGGTVQDGSVTWQMSAGCNTAQTTPSQGVCRTDIFIVSTL